MANSTSSGPKAKADENNNGRCDDQIGPINSGSFMKDAAGPRRSIRESSSKMTPSPSSTRKSVRLGKSSTSPSPPVRRKSERVEKQKVPSPLRRSERTKNHSDIATSGSKSFDSLTLKQKKKKKHKSVKKLTFEAEKAENEKRDEGTSQSKRKRLDARAYRAMMKKKPKIDCPEETNGKDDSIQEGGDNVEDRTNEYFKGSNLDCKEVSNNGMSKGDLIQEGGKNVEDKEDHSIVSNVDSKFSNNGISKDDLIQEGGKNVEDKQDHFKVSNVDRKVSNNGISKDDLIQEGEKSVENKDGHFKGSNFDCKEVSNHGISKDDLIQEGGKNVEDKDEHFKGSNVDCKEVSNNGMAKDDLIQEGGKNVEDKDGHIKGSNVDCKEVSNNGMSKDDLIQEGGKNVEDKDEHFKGSNLDCKEVSNNGMLPSDDAKESVDLSNVEDRGETEATCTAEVSEKGIDCSPSNDVSTEIPADDGKICLICKCGGRLLFCDGKECDGCYHFSCLEPPMVDAPLGVWHCHLCLKKKIELGVYSVSEGVESICDAREVKVSHADGWTTEKHFLVKYKGLAHVHNRWVPESQLLLEAPPLLLEKFNQKDQALKWKQEWRSPHRLLQKRALIFTQQDGDPRSGQAVGNSDCHYEWLVKWHGLGYEHASWELDNASFLRSLEGRRLIKDYEDRHQRAKRVPLSSKVDKKLDRISSFTKLSPTPGGFPPGFGMSNLDAVNKLREHWHKGQNAVVFDDNDRMVKMVAFILSLDSNICRPFLIISTSAALHLWEDEFSCWAPSLNVIVYSGNKEIRRSIRKLEFYGEGGCLLFQVLIVLPEIIIEDLQVLEDIEFEAIMVDESQCSKIPTYLKQIKMLKTDLWILLLSGKLEDSVEEYHDILAFLDHQNHNEDNDDQISNSRDIGQLKDKPSISVAYRCKTDSFRFVEYWVPVNISNVQLEQYCATLLSNSSILRSQSKSHVVEALHDILITTRKCCNHPYLVDESLQSLLIKDLPPAEILDVGIKACGKLQLLDSMLMELKKQGLRVLILFQLLGGSGKVSIGDILDDLIRQRFGPDSYERIDKGVLNSKKQSALKMFNNKDHGRFVFLLESNACHHSIKLSSVDTIIIFDSDWNPLNDIRSLQKITLDSQLERIKIFRLYSSFTVEERALVLAKQDRPIDSKLEISWSACHTLLMWGASSLFDDLKDFHDRETDIISVNTFSGEVSLKQTVHEFSSILKQNGEDNDAGDCSFLLKVKQNGLKYHANFPLLGQLKFKSLDSEPCHLFWTKVLEGKNPRWKYSCGSFQRSRKRVQLFDRSGNKPDFENGEVAKKRAKLLFNADQPYSKGEGEKLSAGNKEGNSGESMESPQGNDVEFLKARKSRDEQRSLHLSLKSEITKLCEILDVPDNVKRMADEFLEYVMNNHHVDSTLPKSILEAFQISLCWMAAALVKHKINHEASLMLAKQHLKFDCMKDEANVIYSMLRCLKNIFLHRTGKYNIAGSPKASASELSGKNYSYTGLALDVELAKKDVLKSIKEIRKKCQKMLRKLLLKHQEEKNKLDAIYEEKKANLERKYKIESAIIRSCAPNDVMRSENLKDLDIEYTGRIEDLKHQHEIHLKDLENVQSIARQKLENREVCWLEDVKSWAQDELLNTLPLEEHENGIEYLKTSRQVEPDNDPKNGGLVSNIVTEGTNFGRIVEAMTGTGMGSSRTPEIISPVAVQCSNAVEGQTPPVEAANAYEGHDRAQNACDSQGEMISVHSHSKAHDFNGATCMMNEGEGHNMVYGGCRDNTVPDSRGIAECYNGREVQTDAVFLDQTATSEEQERMSRTMNNNTLSQTLQDSHAPLLTSPRMVDKDAAVGEIQNSSGPVEQVSRPVDVIPADQSNPKPVMEPREQVQQLRIVESLASDQDTAGEMQRSTQQVEAVSSAVDALPAGQLNHDPIMEPLEQLQQLSSAERLASNLDASGELVNSSQQVEPLVGEPLQQMPQLPPSESPNSTHDPSMANEIELQSNNEDSVFARGSPIPMGVTNQAVVHPSSNSELDSRMGELIAPLLDTRNVFTPSQINNHLRPTATQSMNRTHSPSVNDPLKNELDRLYNESEQTKKYYEDMKLQLKSDCEREIEEIRRRYDMKLQESELEFQRKKKNLDTSLNLVLMNRMWAEAFRSKCMDLRTSGAPGMQQDPCFAQQLALFSRHQRDTTPSLFAGSPHGPPASTLQHFTAAASSQTMALPPVSSMQSLVPPMPAMASSSPMVPLISATTSSRTMLPPPPVSSIPILVPPMPATASSSPMVPLISTTTSSRTMPPPPPVSSMPILVPPMTATASSSPTVPLISTTTSSRTMLPPPPVSSMPILVPPMPATASSSPTVPLISTTTSSRTMLPPPHVSSMPILGPPMPATASSSPTVPLISTTTSSRIMAPPLLAAYRTPSRPPHINSIPPLANHQAGSGFLTTPPHLQPYRPSTSLPDLSQQVPNNIPVMPSLPNRPRPTLPSNMSDPHNRVHRPEIPIVLPRPNSSAREPAMDGNSQLGMNLPRTLLRPSNVTSLQQSEFGTASRAQGDFVRPAMSPDVVCLSDDD